MQTRRLDEGEFQATMTPKMHDVTPSAANVPDIWPYVDSVPAGDLNGHILCDGLVELVYRTDDGRFDHALVMTRTKNVYLAVVVDLAKEAVYGHHLLDLNRLYGLS